MENTDTEPPALRKRAPRKSAKPVGQPAPDRALLLAHRVAELMLEKGAEQLSVLSLGNLTSFADYFVLGSAKSDRQVQAIGRHLSETLKREGHPSLSSEGFELSHWVLMDFGGVVAHIFFEPARSYYDLDGLWADAPRVEINQGDAQARAASRKKAASTGRSRKPQA